MSEVMEGEIRDSRLITGRSERLFEIIERNPVPQKDTIGMETPGEGGQIK